MPVMPDTRIYGGGGGGQQQSPGPLQTLGAMMKIKESQLDYKSKLREDELKQREFEDDDATRHHLQNSERPEDAIELLQKEGRSEAATKLAKNVYEERTARLTESNARIKSQQDRLEQAAQILQGVSDDSSYRPARKAVFDLIEPIYGAGANDMLPTTYDKATLKKLIDAGTTKAQYLQEAHNLNTEVNQLYQLGLIPASEWATRTNQPADPKTGRRVSQDVSEWSPNGLAAQAAWQEKLARQLRTSKNKESWDTALMAAFEAGAPRSVIEGFGTWAADGSSPKKAEQLGMTVAQSEAADNASTRAQANLLNAQASRYRALNTQDAAAEREAHRGELTDLQRNAEEDRREKEDKEAEKLAEDEWRKHVVALNLPEGTAPPPFRYEDLPPKSKELYVQARLRSHDKSRKRLQGLPGLEEAADAASSRGDMTGFQKLRDEFAAITQGLVKLDDYVLPPSPYRGQKTPEAAAYRRQRLLEIEQQLQQKDLDGRAKKRLEKEKGDLRAGRR